MKAIFAICLTSLALRASGAGLTECQRKRESSLRSLQDPKANRTAVGGLGLVVDCNEDGTYKSLQCFGEAVGGGRFCLCYDPEGQVIKQASKKTKSCACHLANYQGATGQTKPVCEIDGRFKKTQCNSSQWWCVDPETGAIKGKKQGGSCSVATCN
ncbi:hypothetical protein BIW11_05927 [Tropilaelaps mercedesae]|uniref:Thyroglobulin type-1 domain-containing protein n=1 Tax=Tropilaelaps mercedesae TaxID=418985 RepID=A0A1V9Y0A3_9ACAR|nr:hypothetical protein BIW11_05927 [Tropilaelaps mercedesae]